MVPEAGVLLRTVALHRFHGSGSPPQIERRKYHVRNTPGGYGICIDQLCGDGLMRTLWAAGHDDLVEIVRSGPGRERGGSFHIDPDGCVVIGDGGPEICAGTYVGRELIFEGFGMTVRSNPDDLQPGDTWTGPSVGRHFKMTSKDIWYESASGKSYALSDFDNVSTPALAARLGKKHPAYTAEGRFRGGRVYVNQHRRVFVPRVEDTEVTGDVYVGELRGLWFPADPV